jgi:cytochrome d ubiquinol oxidase subunit II
LFSGLVHAPWSIPVQVATACAAALTIFALATRRFGLARVAAPLQVGLVVLGWGLAMDGHLVLPDLPLGHAGAQARVLGPVLGVMAVGTLVLAPALWALFRVFKRREGEIDSESATDPGASQAAARRVTTPK